MHSFAAPMHRPWSSSSTASSSSYAVDRDTNHIHHNLQPLLLPGYTPVEQKPYYNSYFWSHVAPQTNPATHPSNFQPYNTYSEPYQIRPEHANDSDKLSYIQHNLEQEDFDDSEDVTQHPELDAMLQGFGNVLLGHTDVGPGPCSMDVTSPPPPSHMMHWLAHGHPTENHTSQAYSRPFTDIKDPMGSTSIPLALSKHRFLPYASYGQAALLQSGLPHPFPNSLYTDALLLAASPAHSQYTSSSTARPTSSRGTDTNTTMEQDNSSNGQVSNMATWSWNDGIDEADREEAEQKLMNMLQIDKRTRMTRLSKHLCLEALKRNGTSILIDRLLHGSPEEERNAMDSLLEGPHTYPGENTQMICERRNELLDRIQKWMEDTNYTCCNPSRYLRSACRANYFLSQHLYSADSDVMEDAFQRMCMYRRHKGAQPKPKLKFVNLRTVFGRNRALQLRVLRRLQNIWRHDTESATYSHLTRKLAKDPNTVQLLLNDKTFDKAAKRLAPGS